MLKLGVGLLHLLFEIAFVTFSAKWEENAHIFGPLTQTTDIINSSLVLSTWVAHQVKHLRE